MERKIFIKVFVLFFLGLLFTFDSIGFLLVDISSKNVTLLKVILYIAVFLLGIFFMILLGRLLVKRYEIPVLGMGATEDLPARHNPVTNLIPESHPKSRWSGWFLTIGGILIVVLCFYLIIAYGPQNDPPGMPAGHKQLDIITNYICASVIISGLVMLWIGIRKLIRQGKFPN
jgi:hypothetical protein